MKTYFLQLTFLIIVTNTFGQTSIPQIGFYPNGQREYENYNVDGRDSLCRNKEWFENGTLRFEQQKNGCNCVSTRYYESGKIAELTIEKIIIDENTQEYLGYELIENSKYCENGQRTEVNDFNIKGIKEFLILNCDGETIISGQMIDNFLHKIGHWIYYWDEGTKKTEGDYKISNDTVDANVKIGKWTYWSEEGRMLREQWFDDNGLLTKELNY